MKWILSFLVMVWKMRRHQNAWFRLHKPSDLYEAKRFEKLVDDEIVKRVVLGEDGPISLRDAEPKQGSLFEQENEQ